MISKTGKAEKSVAEVNSGDDTSQSPRSARWSFDSLTRCGMQGYRRPCQVNPMGGEHEAAFPLVDICAGEGERVLIVEDEEVMREELVEIVSSIGYPVEAVGSAVELRDRVRDMHSGCILLDILMPGQDGLAIQAWINEANITIPVIFISGIRDVPTAVHCMKSGAVEFLQKPIKEMDLRRAINSAIGLSRKRACAVQSENYVKTLVANLTPAERIVANYIADGYPTKLIAAELGRSENTIKIHRQRIFEKLMVSSVASIANILKYI